MTLIQKAITALKDYLRAFVKRGDDCASSSTEMCFWTHDFFTEHNRKTEKLASLARYIEGAKAEVEKRKAQKKKHSDVLAAIQQAQHERLGIESGSIVWSPEFGAWVQKEKA